MFTMLRMRGVVIILQLQAIALVYSNCCTKKLVDGADGSDTRAGIYLFNMTNFDLPTYCKNECLYVKDGDDTGELFCFGEGDLNSQCTGEITEEVNAPPANNVQSAANKFIPGYLTNDMPGANTNEIMCGETISISDELWERVLDIDAMGTKVAATSPSSWSNSGLIMKREDGPSTGAVSYNHLISVWVEDPASEKMYLLNLNMPTGRQTNNAFTRFKIVNADGSACTGSLQYETAFRLVTEDDQFMLDLSSDVLLSWMDASSNTRLHFFNPPTLK
ncbi:uncharacterized protein LOC111706837 [Eurytemora carolleeae]|uniref:uncharacterized protein LOC111706837 n=1 Tax=Eurytemora carolleeae TaxID=1294199 RepID=UPI000C7813F7|nr:uncharacterized protein LOC111706837 [Eurytemora carolleeae]|eukprot:XP_023335535.1 uncharacterized protein LOC111706837 [Eurytemora affinis]